MSVLVCILPRLTIGCGVFCISGVAFYCFSTYCGDCEALEEREEQMKLTLYFMSYGQHMTIHIGKIIERVLREQGRSVSWFAKQICCERTNVYSIFNRSSIDTDLLVRISNVLSYDFFNEYRKIVNHDKEE